MVDLGKRSVSLSLLLPWEKNYPRKRHLDRHELDSVSLLLLFFFNYFAILDLTSIDLASPLLSHTLPAPFAPVSFWLHTYLFIL